MILVPRPPWRLRLSKAADRLPPFTRRPASGPCFLILLLSGLVFGCGADDDGTNAQSGRPPTPVVVSSPFLYEFADRLEALGTASANESVVITARVTEAVKSVHFEDGQSVEDRGDPRRAREHRRARAARRGPREPRRREASLRTGRRPRAQRNGIAVALRRGAHRTRRRRGARRGARGAARRPADPRALRRACSGCARSARARSSSPGDPITTLDDIDRIKLDFSVPETFMSILRSGSRSRPRAPPTRVASSKDGSPRSTAASIRRRAPFGYAPRSRIADHAIRPGMLLTLVLRTNPQRSLAARRAGARAARNESVRGRARRARTRRVASRSGSAGACPGIVEVLSGLGADDRVVIDGASLIPPGGMVGCFARKRLRASEESAMWLSDTSVRRPVLATVLSLLLIAFGALSFQNLPLRELPDVDPPIVSVETTYVGASAAVIENRVTKPIEERLVGTRGHPQDRLGEQRRHLADHDRVRALPRHRQRRERRARPRLDVARRHPRRGRSPGDLQGAIRRQPDHVDQPERRRHGRARADRLRGSPPRRPILRGRRRGAGRPLGRQALFDADLARPDRPRRPRAHGCRHRARPAHPERRAARRPHRVDRARSHRARRARLRDARGFPGARARAEATDGHLVRLGEVARVEIGALESAGDFRGNGTPASGRRHHQAIDGQYRGGRERRDRGDRSRRRRACPPGMLSRSAGTAPSSCRPRSTRSIGPC